MSSDGDDHVKLYSALNQKRRQMFVSLSSSESDDDDGSDPRMAFYSPPKKRSRVSSGSRVSTSSPATALDGNAAAMGDDAARTVVLDDEEDGDLMSASEILMQKKREREMDEEIIRRLAQDTVLNQTRAIMSRITTTKKQMIADGSVKDIISLDSDDDDDGIQLTSQPSSTSSAAAAVAAVQSAALALDKGDRLALQVRSNGSQTDEVVMFSKEPFDVLFERFCDLHGLPRSAVQMALDGEPLPPQGTPLQYDLDSGDLIDAKVDFSKANADKKKQLVRLKLVVEGKKPEFFKIGVTSTLEKLVASFCKKHQISDYDDVAMTVQGDPLRLDDTVEAHQLFDGDEIQVVIHNYVDAATIALNLRYDAKTSRLHHVTPTQKVEALLAQAADHLGVDPSQISLRLDGEAMQPHQSLQYYDLEGGELIEVKHRS